MFSSKHFESYIDMIFVERVIGQIRDLYKGPTCKTFPLTVPHEELIHTISGNLLHFNRESDQVLNVFVIKNVNVRIIADGMV